MRRCCWHCCSRERDVMWSFVANSNAANGDMAASSSCWWEILLRLRPVEFQITIIVKIIVSVAISISIGFASMMVGRGVWGCRDCCGMLLLMMLLLMLMLMLLLLLIERSGKRKYPAIRTTTSIRVYALNAWHDCCMVALEIGRCVSGGQWPGGLFIICYGEQRL